MKMKSTHSQQINKINKNLNLQHKQSTFSFFGQCQRNVPNNTSTESFQFNKLKKSSKKKLNLHQIKIQVDSLCEPKQKDNENESRIINEFKIDQDECSNFDKDKNIKSQNFKRQLKIWSQNRKDRSSKARQNLNSLFNEGFLPNVNKFYSLYKNFDRKNQKAQFLRYTLSANDSGNNSFRELKLAQNVIKEEIPPRKLGMIGNRSESRINCNTLHLTRKQYRTLARGVSLVDIQKIGLANNKISKQNARQLIKNLPQKVEKINLKNTIRSKEVLELLNSESIKQGRLKKLNLSYNKITDTGLKCIQEVLNQNMALQILNLANNVISDQSLYILSRFVRQNENLRNLNLSSNQIKGKNVFMLFEAIQQSRSLLNVNLSRNKIGKFLSEAIPNELNFNEPDFLRQKIQDYSSLKSLCNLLKNNQYLLHFDLSYNQIGNKQSHKIAETFNLYNQRLIGFHFNGNSNFHMNTFCFLTQNPNIDSQTQLVQLDQNLKVNNVHQYQQQFKVPKLQSLSTDIDHCWLCHGWITKRFTFQVQRRSLQIKEALKNPFDKQNIPTEIIKNIYIHLQCYDYQPVLMKCKKKIKSNIINKILQGQRSVKNLINQNQRPKTPSLRKTDLQEKQKSKLTPNTLKNLNQSEKKQQKPTEQNQEIIIYSYSINLKIPSSKNIKYFFTFDGEIFTDHKSQTEKIKNGIVEIQFVPFNPFQQILLNLQKELKTPQNNKPKEKSNDTKDQPFELLKSLINPHQNFSKNPLKLKYFLTEFNIHIHDKESNQIEEKSYLEKYLLQKLYRKLLLNEQQLSNQELNLLVSEKAKITEVQDQGSDKYISSDKMIETKNFEKYQDQNQESTFYVKPRNIGMFFGFSDPKLQAVQFQQFLKAYLTYQEEQKSEKQLKLLDSHYQKAINFKQSNKLEYFFPLLPKNIATNDYSSMFHFQSIINSEKINIDSFTGKIRSIGNFNKESNQLYHNDFDNKMDQKQIIIQTNSKKILTKILPSALILYYNSKATQNSNELQIKQRGIFNKIDSEKKKKNAQKSKRTKQKFKKKNQNQQLTTQPLNISNQSLINSQNHTNSTEKQQEEKKQKNNENIVNFNDMNEQELGNLFSIKLVEEIFNYKKQKTGIKEADQKDGKRTQKQSSKLIKFLQKLAAWKQTQNLYDKDIYQITQTINSELKKICNEKVKRVQDANKTITKKSNKFNIKINKFCSLQSTSPQSLGLQLAFSIFKSQKRQTVDFQEKSKNNSNDQFQYPFGFQKGKSQQGQKNLNQFKIIQNIEAIFLLNSSFYKCFMDLSTQLSISFYRKKIDKFIGKKEFHFKRQAKTLQVINKKKDQNNLRSTKNQLNSTQKTLKYNKLSENLTKNQFFKTKVFDKEEIDPLRGEKNIFDFIQQQKQQANNFLNQKKQFDFPFMEVQEQTFGQQTNLSDMIIKRLDYITLNLISNLDKIKNYNNNLSPESKQVLLKELIIYRSFLLTSPQSKYSKNYLKLVEISQQISNKNVRLSQNYVEKMCSVNFNGILDLIKEYLLYVVYFIAKQVCFLALSDPQKQLKDNKDSGNRKEKNGIIFQNEQLNQNQLFQQKVFSNEQKKPKGLSLLQKIKKNPQHVQDQLKTLMKTVISDVILIITKLHIKYDYDLSKAKNEKKIQQALQRNKQMQQNNQTKIGQVSSFLKSNKFSQKTSKTVSKEKKRTISIKKRKEVSLKKGKNQTEQMKQPNLKGQKIANNNNTKQDKQKPQKKKPKLSLNRVKKD